MGDGCSNTQEAWPSQRHLLIERMCFYRPAVKFRGPAGSPPTRDGARQCWADQESWVGYEGAQEPCEGDHCYLLRF